MKRILKSISTAAAFVLAAGLTTALMSVPAGAATVNSCSHVSGAATFTPGITTKAKNQTILSKGTETGCTPSKSTGGSGTLTATIKATNSSCQTLLKGGQTLKGTGSSTSKTREGLEVLHHAEVRHGQELRYRDNHRESDLRAVRR